MIYQILSADNAFTTDQYVRDWAPSLKNAFHLIPIQQLPDAVRLPVGTFIFSDLERSSAEQRALLAQVFYQLDAHGPPIRLLNSPAMAMGRFELLEALHRNGTNSFRAFRTAEEPADLAFPVVVRVEKDHRGALFPLINSWSELEAAIVRAVMEGLNLRDLMTIEFCDTQEEGLYRRYNAYRIGDRIIPRGLGFSTEWQVKGRDTTPVWRVDVKREFVETNPHAEQLMSIFRLAGIEYGRIDYGLKDGRIQVWEINTCPQFSVGTPEWYYEERRAHHQGRADAIAEAFEAIGQPVTSDRVPINLSWNRQTLALQS